MILFLNPVYYASMALLWAEMSPTKLSCSTLGLKMTGYGACEGIIVRNNMQSVSCEKHQENITIMHAVGIYDLACNEEV